MKMISLMEIAAMIVAGLLLGSEFGWKVGVAAPLLAFVSMPIKYGIRGR